MKVCGFEITFDKFENKWQTWLVKNRMYREFDTLGEAIQCAKENEQVIH